MKFEDCIEHILKWEGGYVWHKDDPGGETNFGIAKKYHPTVDIKNLTKDQAVEIYRKEYWDKNKLEEMPIFLRLAYFDCVVNQGPGGAVKILQRALGVKPDMIFGPQTKAALAKSGIGIVHKFLSARSDHYISLPHFETFGKGWMKRLLDITLETGKGMKGYG